MASHTLNRRTFLERCGQSGLWLGLVPLTHLASVPAGAEDAELVEFPGTTPLLRQPWVQQCIRQGTGALWVAGSFLNQFGELFGDNLDFDRLDPILKKKYQLAGGEWKDLQAAQGLWEKIPAPIRARGKDAILEFHRGKDWSHIIPRSLGGAAAAENGIWWSSVKNRNLGQSPMQWQHLMDARAVLLAEGTLAALRSTSRTMFTGGVAGTVVGTLFSVLDLGLRYLEGDIDRAGFITQVARLAVSDFAVPFVLTGLIAGIALAFPGLVPLMLVVARPLAIVGVLLLAQQLGGLGRAWWDYLEGQGVLNPFLEALATVEASLRALVGSGARNDAGRLVDQAQSPGRFRFRDLTAERLSLDFDVTRHLPDMDLNLAQAWATPPLTITGRLAGLRQSASGAAPSAAPPALSEFQRTRVMGGVITAQQALRDAAVYMAD